VALGAKLLHEWFNTSHMTMRLFHYMVKTANLADVWYGEQNHATLTSM